MYLTDLRAVDSQQSDSGSRVSFCLSLSALVLSAAIICGFDSDFMNINTDRRFSCDA